MDTVEEYIASFDGEVQKRLEVLDHHIKSLNGQITTKISWSMPAYILNGRYFVQFCAHKKHIGLYPGPKTIEKFAAEFDVQRLKYTKGGVQFPHDKELPLELITRIALENCR